MVLLEIFIQRNQVKAQFLRHNMHRSTTSECWIHIHHTGIEAIARISSHIVLWLQTIELLIPMAEADEVAMRQLAALRHTCRARGIKQDKEAVRSNLSTQSIRSIRKPCQILCQQHIALIFIDDIPQLFISNQQLGIGILHHEVQTLLRIAGIQRLIGTTSLQHTERSNSHPFATRNQYRYHILQAQTL